MINNIRFTTDLPDRDQYVPLFLSTGWNDDYRFTDDRIFESIQHSWYCLSAYDDSELVGFGRIISDGVLHALIVDLIITPAYKGRGVGSELLRRLIEQCRTHGIPDIQLFCATGQTGFYLKHGFKARPDNAPGMQIPLR